MLVPTQRLLAAFVMAVFSLAAYAEEPSSSFEALARRFERDVWPLLARGGKDGCVGCHDGGNKSSLELYPDARSSLLLLLSEGYLDGDDPDSFPRRVATKRARRRMPPGDRPGWTTEEIELLREFSAATLDARVPSLDTSRAADEQFPLELLAPFTGARVDELDNTFLTYRQLRGKLTAIFADDGARDGGNLFEERVELLGGADFEKRFNESATASAQFLSALDTITADFAARSYRQRTGPFAGLVSSDGGAAGELRAEIASVFQRILFRPPTTGEVARCVELVERLLAAADRIGRRDFELGFELEVEDVATGQRSRRMLSIPVSSGELGLTQKYVDQTGAGKAGLARHTLERVLSLRRGSNKQSLRLFNEGTRGNVSFAALELRRLEHADGGKGVTIRVAADDPVVEPQGAWKLVTKSGFSSFEDDDESKGDSFLTIPLVVEEDGHYQLTVEWRASSRNAKAVLVEIRSHDDSRLAHRTPPAKPPEGEARFTIDETVDSVPYHDLRAFFRFEKDDFVEINNAETTRRVTADAVKFVPLDGAPAIIVDNHEADGREGWSNFNAGRFRAYNRVGPDAFHDANKSKGKLALLYRPSIRSAWQGDRFYGVHVAAPGKRDHERHAPVVVHATESAPIVRIVHPRSLRSGASAEFDASATYTVQRGELRFRWRQTNGAAVRLEPADARGAVLRFEVPEPDVAEAAWVGLCRALVGHPDFLFTRPPSLARTVDGSHRRRLQLMKVALDLVGRPPNDADLARLAGGATIDELVDAYLETEDFRDFYFHRIRLYLESHGTPLQDEPVRLWCYVAFNDRSFKEILTADYTVDETMRRKPRPPEHGRSGVLTTAGFIEGKLGLPHFNYAAQVAEKFLGYVFEVSPEIEAERVGLTAAATTSPDSSCYSCHKLLTPLAYQRLRWDDRGVYREVDDENDAIDDSDRGIVDWYPFKGRGMEAFAIKAVEKERFIRAMINSHVIFYFGRELRHREDERVLYRELWDHVHENGFTIRGLIRAIMASPEYLEGHARERAAPAKNLEGS